MVFVCVWNLKTLLEILEILNLMVLLEIFV